MGNYITQAKITSYIGATQLSNLSGKLTGADLAAFISDVITRAEGQVDFYLCRRYAVPVAASGIVESMVMRAVEMELWGRQPGKDVPDRVRKNWESTVEDLREIAKGELSLPNTIAKLAAPMISSGESAYTSMGRFC